MPKRRRRNLKFPFIVIWSEGRSLDDSDCPGEFRSRCYTGLGTLCDLLRLSSVDGFSDVDRALLGDVANEALFLLCCLHRDFPEELADRPVKHFEMCIKTNDLFRLFYRNFANILGAGEEPWQHVIFLQIIEALRNSNPKTKSAMLQILGVAIWRNEKLLDQFRPKTLEIVLGELEKSLQLLVAKVRDIRVLGEQIELLLGLLRTRLSDVKEVRMLLAPERPVTQRFAHLVDQITDTVCSKKIALRSRIQILVEKPSVFHNTPDILYALRLYLTGDSGAKTVQVTGVREVD